MSKKSGKRNKGNGGPQKSRRSTTPPRQAQAAPSPGGARDAVKAQRVSHVGGALAIGGTSAGRPPSHGELLVAQAVAEAAAEAIASAPALDELPARDEQEESGPRIVAHAPPKAQEEFHHEEKVIVVGAPGSAAKGAKPAKAGAKAGAKSEAAREPEEAEEPAGAAEANEDDISIPPVVELEHESFFAEGEKADKEHREMRAAGVSRAVEHDEHDEQEEDTKRLKMSPAVRERRARFTKYVKWAVGASAVVCLAALVRVAVARGQHDADPTATAAAHAQLPPVAAQVAPAAQAPAAQAPAEPPQAPAPAEPAPAAASPASDTKPGDAPAEAKPAEAKAPDAKPADGADVQPDPVAAKEERTKAQKALDRGDAKTAITAGERAVALDPTDGDAWLLLGAAYLEKGKGADARRAFVSCTKQGKKGAIGECAKMLR